MSWFKNLFGKNGSSKSAAEPSSDAPSQSLLDTAACRDRYWATVGRSESDFITYLISPQFMGGATWPTTRQAYRVVRTDNSVIVATDGLSDPFDDVEGTDNGFEMELYLETRDLAPDIAGAPGQVESLKSSWAFVVLEQVAAIVAGAGGVVAQLEKYGVLSVELPGIGDSPHVAEQVPGRFLKEDGTLGLLLDVSANDRPRQIADTPHSLIRMVAVTVITGTELERIRAGGAAERVALAQQMSAKREGHFSDLTRASLV